MLRAIRWLAVVLVVLAGLGLALDRAGAWFAGRSVADQVAEELAANRVESAPPEAGVRGFPFLTQVVAGRYESVELTLRDVGRDGLRLPLVELTATDVEASVRAVLDRSGPVHADRVTGTALIEYGSVVELAETEGLELLGGADGTLRVRLPTTVGGVRVVLVGRAEVEVEAGGGALRVRPVELTVVEPEDLPPAADPLIDRVANAVSMRVPLPPLPYGLTVEAVRVEPAGIVVDLDARDVQLAG